MQPFLDPAITAAMESLHAETGCRFTFPVPMATATPNDMITEPVLKGMCLDTETTGLEWQKDDIVQLGLTPFMYGAETGRVYDRFPAIVFHEEPKAAMTPEAFAVHKIAPDAYMGKRFDEAVLKEMLINTSVLIAHNASYDRPFLERRFPWMSLGRPWGCTFQDIPWKSYGYGGAKLEWLLYAHTQSFVNNHNAGADTAGTVHLLTVPFQAEDMQIHPFSHVLTAIRQTTYRVFAVGSPYHTKDTLKKAGYRWNDPENADSVGHFKAWWKDVTDIEAEKGWLSAQVYRRPANPAVIPLDSHARFLPHNFSLSGV